MRPIDADELMEHVYRDKLDSRELIAEMINNAPTAKIVDELKGKCQAQEDHIEYLNRKNSNLKGQIKALVFAVKCNGVSGNEVEYEDD